MSNVNANRHSPCSATSETRTGDVNRGTMNFDILAGLTDNDLQTLKESATPEGLHPRNQSVRAVAVFLSNLGLLHCPPGGSTFRPTRLGEAALEADARRREA